VGAPRASRAEGCPTGQTGREVLTLIPCRADVDALGCCAWSVGGPGAWCGGAGVSRDGARVAPSMVGPPRVMGRGIRSRTREAVSRAWVGVRQASVPNSGARGRPDSRGKAGSGPRSWVRGGADESQKKIGRARSRSREGCPKVLEFLLGGLHRGHPLDSRARQRVAIPRYCPGGHQD